MSTQAQPPAVSEVPIVVQLKAPRRGVHPWVFQRTLVAPSPRPPSGAIAELRYPDGSFAGRGFYNGRARVGFRVLEERADVQIDRAWFAERLGQALSLRREVLGLDDTTDAYRVVNAEGDGMGGLVVDRFGDLLVIEWFARSGKMSTSSRGTTRSPYTRTSAESATMRSRLARENRMIRFSIQLVSRNDDPGGPADLEGAAGIRNVEDDAESAGLRIDHPGDGDGAREGARRGERR